MLHMITYIHMHVRMHERTHTECERMRAVHSSLGQIPVSKQQISFENKHWTMSAPSVKTDWLPTSTPSTSPAPLPVIHSSCLKVPSLWYSLCSCQCYARRTLIFFQTFIVIIQLFMFYNNYCYFMCMSVCKA